MGRVAVAIVALLLAYSAAAAKSRIALIVTNQAYTQPGLRLTNTHRDGDLVKTALEKVGFKVWVVKDTANEHALLQAIGEHLQRLSEAGPDAVGFFYYSGHGAADRVNGENFLIPTNVPVTHASQLPLVAVRLEKITSTLAGAGRMSFVVFDACRNVPLLRGDKDLGVKGFVAVREQRGLLVAFATEPGNVAVDQSVYARALADEIVKPGLEAGQVFRAVRGNVLKATKDNQAPQYLDSRLSDFHFAAAVSVMDQEVAALRKQLAQMEDELKRQQQSGAGTAKEIRELKAELTKREADLKRREEEQKKQQVALAAPAKAAAPEPPKPEVTTPILAEPKLIAILKGHIGWVRSAAFSPDGKRIVTLSGDMTGRLWDGYQGQIIAVLRGHTDHVWSAAFSPDGKRLLTASADKTARLWDAERGQEFLILRGHTGTLWDSAFSPDGRRVLTASSDYTARLWDAQTGKVIDALEGDTSALTICVFSPDGRRILTASQQEGTTRLWDGDRGQEIVVLQAAGVWVLSAAFSSDSKRGASSYADGVVRLWNAETGKEIAVLKGHYRRAMSVAFSPDGKLLLTASEDGTARLWDGHRGQEIAILKGHAAEVNRAVFSRDGKVVVTASSDKTARLWDTLTGQEIVVLKGHTGRVYSAAFSPDGKRVVTASEDKTARLWQVR